MEDVLGGSFLEPGVPNEAHSIRIVGRLRVLVVTGQEQLGEHCGPVHGGDDPILGPAFVVKATVQRKFDAATC